MNYERVMADIDIIFELSKRGMNGKATGNNLQSCCPFHLEHNPSFGTVIEGERKGLFNCFSCGERGNFFKLIAYLDGVEIEDVIRKYVKKEISIEEISRLKNYFISVLSKEKKKDTIRVISEKFLDQFEEPYGNFLRYLIDERKLTEETIKKFNIKCCNKGKWKDRIIIPWYDEKNRLIGTDARKIYKTDKLYKMRKIKGSDVSKVLFGLNRLEDKTKLVLVEGSFDAIFLQQYNIPAVAIGCVSISKHQIKLIVKYAEEVTISLDGDMKYEEKKPLKRMVEELRKFMAVKIIMLPDSKDPNDLTEDEINVYYR